MVDRMFAVLVVGVLVKVGRTAATSIALIVWVMS
jgi:hypothetical protein